MASDGVPVNPPVTRLVQGSQASISGTVQKRTGNPLLGSGQVLPAREAAHPHVDPATKAHDAAPSQKHDADLQALIARLNKHFNDSGQPIQFRVDPNSDSKFIQEINPATGEVVGEYLAAEFPALARGLGVSGLVVDSHA
jgi:FlaG protein